MDITIKCQLSLSKKLRALIQEGETRITLVAPTITDGRGEANMVISSDKPLNKNLTDFLGRETSIILVPMELVDVTVDNSTVGTIFTKNLPPKVAKTSTTSTTATAAKAASPVRSAIDRIATYAEPEDGEEGYAIKTEDEIAEEMPEQFNDTKNPAFKNYVDTIEALDNAIKSAKNKVSDIDPSLYPDNVRKRMELAEAKEKAEGIDADAFIVNTKCANLAVNDLGINLILNVPYNLANVSAKRLAGSRELRNLFKAGWIKLIKPEEIPQYINMAEDTIQKPTLDVYSSPEEAEEQMERSGMNVEKIDIGGSDLSRPTENETLLTNLTARPPVRTGGVVKTMHGNAAARPARNVSQEQQANAKGLKTIRRTGLSY